MLPAVGERSGDAKVEPKRTAFVLRSAGLERWHLLSLDAPTVAAAWTWFVARAAGISLPGSELATTFLAVWVLYAADRLLDAQAVETGTFTGLEHRHLFHHRWRVAFRRGIGLACLGLAALLPIMSPTELARYLLLGALLAGWFLVIHTATKPLPKELVVGPFFAAAVFIPTLVRTPGTLHLLAFPAFMLAAVCSLNCLFIFAWESETRLVARPHRATKVAARLAVPLALSLACLCGVSATFPSPARPILLACGASTLLLCALHVVRARFGATSLRALADCTLLAPLLLRFLLL